MLADIPKRLEGVSKEDLDKEILRVGMIAELDAVSLYEQMAAMTRPVRRRSAAGSVASTGVPSCPSSLRTCS